MMGRRSGHRLVLPRRDSLRRPLATQRLIRSALGRQLLLSHSAAGHFGPVRLPLLAGAGSWGLARHGPSATASSTSPGYPTISARTTSGPSCNCCRSPAGGRRTRRCRIGRHPTNHGCRPTSRDCVLSANRFPILGNLRPDNLVSVGSLRRLRRLPSLGRPLSPDLHLSIRHAFAGRPAS